MPNLIRRQLMLATAAAICLPVAHGQNVAANYPNKPVRFIVAFPPGGGTDTLARLIGQSLSTELGQPVVVENKPGASGLIAAQFVANAEPDGYTLLIGGSGPMVFNPVVLASKMPYDPEKDLATVTILGSYPLVIAVKNDLPVKNLDDFVKLVRSKPGAMSYGHAGVTFQVPMEAFLQSIDLKMIAAQYKGGGPAMQAIMGGEIDAVTLDLTSIASAHRSNRVRAIAVTSHKRNPLLPDVPTLAEYGYMKDFEATAFTALGAPGGTPAPILEKIQVAVAKVLQSPEVKSRLDALGIEPGGKSPQETLARYRREISVYTPIARNAGLIQSK